MGGDVSDERTSPSGHLGASARHKRDSLQSSRWARGSCRHLATRACSSREPEKTGDV